MDAPFVMSLTVGGGRAGVSSAAAAGAAPASAARAEAPRISSICSRALRRSSAFSRAITCGQVGGDVEELAREIFALESVLNPLRTVQAIVTLLEKYPKDRATRSRRGSR